MPNGTWPIPEDVTVPAVVPRWEWRTFFSEGLPRSLRDRFSDGVAQMRPTDETYILSLATPHNVKIRDGRLEIKELEASERGLERWRPTLVTPFPIEGSSIHAACEALGIPAPIVVPRHATVEEFLRDVIEPVATLRVVHLLKRRERHVIEGCMAEVAVLDVGSERWTTLAIEDADVEHLLAAVDHLGIGPRPNVSYPAALKQITGFTSNPALRAEEGIW
jgi:exopolyphosphatase/guanosine-5'-triphosphate,3'-diphosphate pyrophosphatase